MSNLIDKIGAKMAWVGAAIKEATDKGVDGIARGSCSVYEDQFLCTAARGHEQKERILDRWGEEQARMKNRQMESALKRLKEKYPLYYSGRKILW